MFTVNTIVKPLPTADSEYSVCGNSVLRQAKVVEVFPRKENGNNIKIEITDHINPNVIGKRYSVDDRYFKAVEPEWIWIDAYKATDENMCCKGKQYLLGVEDYYNGDVVLGSKGYHVCYEMEDCFREYPYAYNRRYFAVKAFVKRTDFQYMNPNNTTLVAKAIKFVDELDYDEVLDYWRDHLDNIN